MQNSDFLSRVGGRDTGGGGELSIDDSPLGTGSRSIPLEMAWVRRPRCQQGLYSYTLDADAQASSGLPAYVNKTRGQAIKEAPDL